MDRHVVGYTSQGWNEIRTVFEENFLDQLDIGAGLCIYHRGQCVVDLTGGFKRINDRSDPYTSNTLQLVYSASKGVMAAAVAVCVERNWLDYDQPVCKYWPEFGVQGKQNITIAEVLAHRAGISYVDEDLALDDVLNWSRMTSLLEKQKPHWKSGTAHGYHAHTTGYVVGELIQRVDPLHRTYGEFVREEIDPEFYVGIPNDQIEELVSPLIRKELEANSLRRSDIESEKSSSCSGGLPLGCQKMLFNEVRTHRAQLPAVNGITKAKSLARIYARLIGDVNENGQTYRALITEKTLERAIEDITPDGEADLNWYNLPSTFSRSGFQTFGPCFNIFGQGVFGHSGFGGSCAFAYPAEKLAFAYVCNYLDPSAVIIDPRTIRVIERIKTILSEEDHRKN